MKRVLIADDEPIERMIVSRTVEKYFSEELTVVSAANGREAVEQFFAGDCQIALLDIEMPGMNGLEAADCRGAGDRQGSRREEKRRADLCRTGLS